MAYILVLLISLIDWSISLSSSCHEVRRVDAWMNVREAGNLWIKRWPMIIVIWDWDKKTHPLMLLGCTPAIVSVYSVFKYGKRRTSMTLVWIL